MALLRLRDQDGSGRVEIWAFDDGTKPENAKATRVGPRWGIVQSDGKVLVVGILYANYLGGWEGDTASACDGRNWFDRRSSRGYPWRWSPATRSSPRSAWRSA